MKKLVFTLMATSAAVIGGVVAFTPPYDKPAKAKATTGIDPSLIMSHAVNLPVVHYDDYSVVFN